MTRNNRSRRQSLRVQRLEDRTVPSSVQGTVFNDANSNGVFDSGEAGVPGWTVYVDNSNGTIHDPGEATAVTDATGNYFIDTTLIPPNANGWDYFSLDLQVGTGGRWLNTTAGTVYAHPVNEPAAVRDFGVHFEPYVSVEPNGPETLVNTTTAGTQGVNITYQWEQLPHSVAADANGNYVVTWSNLSTPAVLARVFNPDGTPRTGELVVASSSGVNPQVAMADNGRFVVAWDGLARLYKIDGTPASSVISVVPSTQNYSYVMTGVAMDAVGNFDVLYKATKSGGPFGHGGPTITVQRFTAAGAANGKPIDVFTTGLVNGGTSLAMDATGRFVVAWSDAFVNASNQIILNVDAQRFSASGQKVGSQILVTSAPNPGVYLSSMSMNGTGRFAVAWKDWSGTALSAQVYDWGTPVGGPVTVTGPGGQVGNSASDIDANGNVTFTWDGSNEIRFRRLTAGGVLEPELLVNTTTQGNQSVPSIAVTGNDRFVVTWEGYGPGDDSGVFAQRFKPLGMSPIGNPGSKEGDDKSLAIWVGGKKTSEVSWPQLASHQDRAQANNNRVTIAPREDVAIPTPRANDDNPWFTFDSRDWLANVTDEELINDFTFVGL